MPSMQQIVEKATGKEVSKEEYEIAIDRMTDEGPKFDQPRAIDAIDTALEKLPELKQLIANDNHGGLNGTITGLMAMAYVWGQREHLRGATAKWSSRRHG